MQIYGGAGIPVFPSQNTRRYHPDSAKMLKWYSALAVVLRAVTTCHEQQGMGNEIAQLQVGVQS